MDMKDRISEYRNAKTKGERTALVKGLTESELKELVSAAYDGGSAMKAGVFAGLKKYL